MNMIANRDRISARARNVVARLLGYSNFGEYANLTVSSWGMAYAHKTYGEMVKPLSPVVSKVADELPEDADGCIFDEHPAGSQERIGVLTEHYNAVKSTNTATCNQSSPFIWTDQEIEDMLVIKLSGKQTGRCGQITGDPTRQHSPLNLAE